MKVCTLKNVSYILLAVTLGLLLSAALLLVVRSSAAAAPDNLEDCLTTVIQGPSGFVNQTWEAAPTGDACLILQMQEPEGFFNISAGWVFTAPLKINGVVITTTVVPGQMAPQIAPVSFEVITGSVLVVEPSWNPVGTEIGFWWNYTPPQDDNCATSEISGESGFVHQTWPVGENKPCLELQINEQYDGVFNISAGWVFTSPLKLDGNVMPTHSIPGELAPQIDPASINVVTGSVLTMEATINPSGTEVGFWWNYEEETNPPVSFTTYLPIIMKPQQVLSTEVELSESPDLQVKTAGWPGAIPGEEACMIVNFTGTSSQALIESGWFFGNTITKSELNGIPFNISPLPPPPGETAMQITSLLLNNTPQRLQICIMGVNPGLEIGLRFRYPAP